VDPVYQAGPHVHSADIAAGNGFVVVSELGADQLMVYRFAAATGKLTLNPGATVTAKPGTGPRHFAFSANGKFGYSLGEMSGVITVFSWDGSRGMLKEIQSLETKPKTLASAGGAELTIHPNGRFLYTTNRGPDTILTFAIDAASGKLTPVDEVSSRGMAPRSFGIDPTGSYLLAANQATDDVIIFKIDGATGRIVPTRSFVTVSTAVCVKFLPLS
jgi:6-phosphogluconolactonase